MKHIKTKIGIVAIVFTVGIAAVAFSHGWNGSGYGGYMMGPGNGGHMMGYGPYEYGNLSPQDAAKLEQSQQKFLNDTSELLMLPSVLVGSQYVTWEVLHCAVKIV